MSGATVNLSAYARLGASASKDDIHLAVADSGPGLFPGAFCRISPDVLADDPQWCCALHADGAGTKALVAYLLFRETGDASVFRHVAQDALVMNLDDLLCIGAVDRFLFVNTICRNRFRVPIEVVREVVVGFQQFAAAMASWGVRISATGGETADLGDAVRTIVVDAAVATRLRRDQVIDCRKIVAGDAIVGLSSTGQARYETVPNSGIGANGLTLARHMLLNKDYLNLYPESVSPEVDGDIAYNGPFFLRDEPAGYDLGMSIGAALASPTRTYAPVVRALLAELGPESIHGLIHNTGGGLAKCRRFGIGVNYVKDDLFPLPPLFRIIQTVGKVEWPEMYQTFNMGHRFEVIVPAPIAPRVVAISQQFDIAAQVIGRCEARGTGDANAVTLVTPHGTFHY